MSIGREDRLWWVSSKRGLFKVNSFFSSLACSEGSRFPWKNVWRTQASLGFFSFSWSAVLGKILIEDNLRKMHVIIVDKWCLCKRYGKSVDHLILHCDLASALWIALFTRFVMSWVMLRRVIDLFACWWTCRRPMSAAIWKMVLICLFGCVWKERNRHVPKVGGSL